MRPSCRVVSLTGGVQLPAAIELTVSAFFHRAIGDREQSFQNREIFSRATARADNDSVAHPARPPPRAVGGSHAPGKKHRLASPRASRRGTTRLAMAPRVAVLVAAVAFAAVLLMASAQDFNAPPSAPAPAPTSGAAGGVSALALASSALVSLLAATLMH
ncbi:hypothetical protein GUJ93_ZPchr0012g21613 [Zizania palustris]|uniref:Uncharacterized protein n=1 Tax=Zizania palustris TaxID=103762 RepID=A0A8J6BSW1_ZIZPA|nr:hypothetical protein GUJ93_ZPchr0012g21613 [Zizania palustris]